MPNFSGVWNLKEQIQAIAAGRWQLPPPKFELYAWGQGSLGRLGDNTTVSKSSPNLVAGTNWAQVSAGGYHTAAVTAEGTLFTWGYGGYLGHNNTVSKSSPTQVGALTNWAQA